MRLDDLTRRVDELLSLGQRALDHPASLSQVGGGTAQDSLYAEFKSASLSFLDRTFGVEGAYSAQFRHEVTSGYFYALKRGMGILQAARGELAGGWLASTRALLSAEVFADFLEMAEYLLDEHYKDPAAVLTGGTLEEHLRQLSTANGIPVEESKQGKMVPRKAEALNADLAKSVYTKLDQKTVTVWLDLRNKAAHAHYSEYNEDQVRGMLVGVREFIARVHL